MPKNLNKELLERINSYLRQESLKNGGREISPSMAEIAKAIHDPENPTVGPTGKPYSEKIMRNVNSLQRMGIIQIIKGKGSQGNTYRYLGDGNFTAIVEETKTEQFNNLENYAEKLSLAGREIITYCTSLTNKNVELEGTVAHLKSLLAELEYTYMSDGKPIFTTQYTSSKLPSVIDEIKKELKTNKNKKSETEQPGNEDTLE